MDRWRENPVAGATFTFFYAPNPFWGEIIGMWSESASRAVFVWWELLEKEKKMKTKCIVGLSILLLGWSHAMADFPSFPISTIPSPNVGPPRVDGDIVVWDDHPEGAAKRGIYGYILSTSSPFTVDNRPAYQGSPDISGNIVVWRDDRDGATHIYGRDLSPSGTGFSVCLSDTSPALPAVSGNTVVWQDERNRWSPDFSGMDVYGYNLVTTTEFAVCTDPGDQGVESGGPHTVAISGDIVVWQDDRNGNWDIYGHDLSSDEQFSIVTEDSAQEGPAVSGDIIVWQDERNGNWDIYAYDLSSDTEFAVCTVGGDQKYPSIDGNFIVWCDLRSGSSSIYGYDLSTGSEFVICTSGGIFPDISGNVVVWRSSGVGIYGAIIPEPATLGLMLVGGLALMQRKPS